MQTQAHIPALLEARESLPSTPLKPPAKGSGGVCNRTLESIERRSQVKEHLDVCSEQNAGFKEHVYGFVSR